MELPQGYDKARTGQVCKLTKSLYGLKQVGRQWNIELSEKLQQFGFIQSFADHCLFIKEDGRTFTALLVYVDDLLITRDNLEDIKKVKQNLHRIFSIKNLGNAQYFLGLEILRDENGMYISQRKYILNILSDAGVLGAKPAHTPLLRDLKLRANQGKILPNPDRFKRLVGRLLYLNFTCPDIT